jgi:hypothetical protein
MGYFESSRWGLFGKLGGIGALDNHFSRVGVKTHGRENTSEGYPNDRVKSLSSLRVLRD